VCSPIRNDWRPVFGKRLVFNYFWKTLRFLRQVSGSRFDPLFSATEIPLSWAQSPPG